jgi:hypothetical protein
MPSHHSSTVWARVSSSGWRESMQCRVNSQRAAEIAVRSGVVWACLKVRGGVGVFEGQSQQGAQLLLGVPAGQDPASVGAHARTAWRSACPVVRAGVSLQLCKPEVYQDRLA